MTTTRQFRCEDLFRFNNVNLDPLTETYHLGFYLTYLARWPEYMTTAVSSNGDVMGYSKKQRAVAEGTDATGRLTGRRTRREGR